ncbi:VanW family protein [uncultured Aquimarina sp.]|uniref:VanW family protein n=1 Tax=uncultured Aquimarina sp. TaxID=575652 RepID=UPI00262D5A24|nr:VanW family protein [uncultured Aquimarina sp.]
MIRKIIPPNIKIKIHLVKNFIFDVFNGYFFLYAKKQPMTTDFQFIHEISQQLKPNEAKEQNLIIAIKSIECFIINPNEIFSFWKIVGNPTLKKGYKESRSLVNGKIKPSIGGGLCQLAGLIYYSSLYANLEIIERHNHSKDIYTDETRFTPLGSDATVAYGYKDLKIKNNLQTPIKFTFKVTEKSLTINLNHNEIIQKNVIEFHKTIVNKSDIKVVTLVNKKAEIESTYKRYIVNDLL